MHLDPADLPSHLPKMTVNDLCLAREISAAIDAALEQEKSVLAIQTFAGTIYTRKQERCTHAFGSDKSSPYQRPGDDVYLSIGIVLSKSGLPENVKDRINATRSPRPSRDRTHREEQGGLDRGGACRRDSRRDQPSGGRHRGGSRMTAPATPTRLTFERGYVTLGPREWPAVRAHQTGNVYRFERLVSERLSIQAVRSGSRVAQTFRAAPWVGAHRGYSVIRDPLSGYGFRFADLAGVTSPGSTSSLEGP